jgi:hypothetical protein
MADSPLQKLVDAGFADARTFAGRLSDTAKYIWVGSFGLFFAALSAGQPPLKDFYDGNRAILLVAALLGAGAFLADALKNYCGFRFANELIGFASNADATDPRPTDAAIIGAINAKIAASPLARANRLLLGLSLICAALSALLILVAFARHLQPWF